MAKSLGLPMTVFLPGEPGKSQQAPPPQTTLKVNSLSAELRDKTLPIAVARLNDY